MPTPAPPEPSLQQLIERPDEERLREYKYRFAQCVVFGLPVIALQLWGAALGPLDAERWGSVLQALLAGWVVYVNLGMIVEGLLLIRRRITADFFIATFALVMYLWSVASVVHIVVTGHLWHRPLLFAACVTTLALWTGVQWLRYAITRRPQT